MIRFSSALVAFSCITLHCGDLLGDPPDRVGSAQAFIATLETDERGESIRDFDHPDRFGWSFFPAKRTGLRIGDLDDEERAALDVFLEVALGENGLAKVRDVLVVEPVTERGSGVRTGPGEYVIHFYGPVSNEGLWAWRLEGHHIVLTQMLDGEEVIASTPSFLGSSPMRSPDGIEPLRREIGIATTLARGFPEEKRQRAIQPMPPGEIVSGMKVNWDAPKRQGVAASELTDQERKQLRALANEHVATHATDVVDAFFAEWDGTPAEEIHFVYFGGLDQKGGHGYRLQGPQWVMEYVNVQGGANHVHTVWRMHEGEFRPIASRQGKSRP